MNFFINQALGTGNSGVEHAQFYRAQRFEQAGLPYRFVFLNLLPDLHQAMDKWQLADDKVLNLWEYLVLGDDYLESGLTERYLETSNDLVVDRTNTHRKRDRVTESGIRYVEHYVKRPDKHDENNDILQVVNYRTELFNARTGERKVMYEVIDDPHRKTLISNIHLFNEHGQHLFFRNLNGLHRYFFEKLDQVYGGKSNFIIDRGEIVDDVLMQNRIPNSKLIYIVHADQLANRDDVRHPLWNDHYEYMLEHMQDLDQVITATQKQKTDMLIDQPENADRITVIPVGGVADREQPIDLHARQTPLQLITASRLANEKHIDIAIKAVVQLHEQGTPINFDIYGQGEMQTKLQELIQTLGADDYIHLKGLSDDLEHVYPEYDAFISTSWSEGFGLTYIEALNAALPVVTFDTRFGAQELIQDGVNGFLQPLDRDDEAENVQQMVRGLERLLQADNLQLKQATQVSVKPFENHGIANKWKELLDALRVSE